MYMGRNAYLDRQRRWRAARRQARIDALPQDLDLAEDNIEFARAFRRQIRRKAAPGPSRNERIDLVLSQLADDMVRLRPMSSLVPYGEVPEALESRLFQTTAAIRRERESLRRMRR